MTPQQHIWDIIVRSIKTFGAAFVATLTASGVDVVHMTISRQLAIAALAAGVTAILNAGIGLHQSIVNPPAIAFSSPEVITPSPSSSVSIPVTDADVPIEGVLPPA